MKSDNHSLPLSVTDSPLGASVGVAMIEHIFDHVPEIAFFIKDRQGRYVAVNQSLVQRCGLKTKQQLLGRTVAQVFPRELANVYSEQDQKVLRTGQPIIDHLDMHWYVQRKPGWCLTTKLPIFDHKRAVIGVVGISRDLQAPGRSGSTLPGVIKAIEYLQSHLDEHVTPAILAGHANLQAPRFARLIKRIFHLTPNQLILQTRLSVATQLLTETEDTIADIACTCGFYDHSALTRSFRSVTKLTPTQFRAMHRQVTEASRGSKRRK